MSKGTVPILKWAGGKRQLMPEIIKKIPENYNCYYEPFLGGAAVLLNLKPKEAIVNDLNKELINVYRVVKKYPDKLLEFLQIHEINHSEEYYYQIRAMDREPNYSKLSPIEKAARIIYLNHTCYNGLYRVNRDGYFNTPIGKYKNPNILNKNNILEVSKYFNDSSIKFSVGDYKKILKDVEKDDFVYLDPPYDPLTDSASFTMYTKEGFGKNNQKELKKVCDYINKKGAKFLQSNSDTEYIRELYKDYKIVEISASRMINSKAKGRAKIKEVLISNY